MPVLREEVVAALARPRAVLVDATVGDGGHAVALLAASGPESRLLGLDLDPSALAEASRVLEPYGRAVRLVHGTFADLARIAPAEGFALASGVLFDLGLRSGQLAVGRGFSFREGVPLDMRFDPTGSVELPEPTHPALRRLARERGACTAADVLASLSARDLADLLRTEGDEPFAERIAAEVARTRKRVPLTTTSDLASLVVRSLPPRARHGRIHAATRTFQALRIAVNRERESLAAGLQAALRLLAPGGRLAVISYHSGEDRLVKQAFRSAAAAGGFALVTAHPLRPSAAEVAENPRSRSAKLRILERHRSS